MLPGIEDNHVEFYGKHPEEMRMIHAGRKWNFEEFPNWIIENIQAEMKRTATRIQCVKEFIYTYFRGLDNEPDMTADGVFNYSEYCPGNKTLPLSNGRHLTATEMRVLSIIYKPNKNIADDLNMSIETVNSHVQNISEKTGLFGKIELSIFGRSKGITQLSN